VKARRTDEGSTLLLAVSLGPPFVVLIFQRIEERLYLTIKLFSLGALGFLFLKHLPLFLLLFLFLIKLLIKLRPLHPSINILLDNRITKIDHLLLKERMITRLRFIVEPLVMVLFLHCLL
jgi:hypothetical protein